jgi:hypothetical protein
MNVIDVFLTAVITTFALIILEIIFKRLKRITLRKIVELFTGKKERFYLCLTDRFEHFKYFPLCKGKIYSERYRTEIATVSFYATDKLYKKDFKRIV